MEPGRLRSLAQDSFRRRVRTMVSSRAGFLALGSSLHPQPSHSAKRNSGHPSSDGLGRCRSPITVAGPRPILTAFPFSLSFQQGTTGTRVANKRTTGGKVALAPQGCQWELFQGGISCPREAIDSQEVLFPDGGWNSPLHDLSSPSGHGCLSFPGRACTLRISSVTGRAAIHDSEAASDKGGSNPSGKGIRTTCLPGAQSG